MTILNNPSTNWARALLPFPNLALLVLDTTGMKEDSDIIRCVIADSAGKPQYDWHIQPRRQPGEANTAWTGIAAEDLTKAAPLTEIWPQIVEALTGRYILAYGINFIRARLYENTAHYELPSLHFIGDCLLERAKRYYGRESGVRLIDICAGLGCILPKPANARDRAYGQAMFLKAMAEGRR